MKKPRSICIFGDSVPWGAWDMEKGGWVNRLWLHVARRVGGEYVEIYNCSISGGTSDTILERLETEARARGADALIFQTGGNDASYEHIHGNCLVAPHVFRLNLEKIIRVAKNITEHVVFMDLKNCDESKTMPVPWADIYYTNDNIRKYREIMRETCAENNVSFLEIGKLGNEDFDDGLHPNAEGHHKIFVMVKAFLIENRWI